MKAAAILGLIATAALALGVDAYAPAFVAFFVAWVVVGL